jgi:hypothetical protein
VGGSDESNIWIWTDPIPQAARLQCCNHVALTASGVTSHEDFAAAAFVNGQARVAIGMGWALCQVTTADPPAA